MGQRSVQINSLVSYLQLLIARHAIERAHVVQAIGKFYQNHPDVLRKRKKHFPKILGLLGSTIFKYSSDFRKAIDDAGDFFSKHPLDIDELDVGIFDNIV